jgi:hypothetical protein
MAPHTSREDNQGPERSRGLPEVTEPVSVQPGFERVSCHIMVTTCTSAPGTWHEALHLIPQKPQKWVLLWHHFTNSEAKSES